MLGVQSVIDGIDESIVGRVLNAPDIESPDVEDRKRSKGWWVYEQDAIQHARSVWQNRDRSTGNGLQGDVVRWVSRVLDLARSEINSAGTEGVTFKDMLDYVRPGPRQGRQRLAAEKHSQPKQLYVDVSLVEPTALSGALRRIALLVLASELSGDEEYAKTASIEVRRWILGEGMSLPPSVLTSQRKGLDQRTPNPKQHLMAASSQLPAFLDALRILHRDGRLVDAWQEIRQVLATMLRFLLASDIARDMDLKSREWQSVRGDAVIAALSGFLGDVRSWNRIITGARMRIGGSLGNDEGCLDIPQQATTSDEETDGAEILDGGKPLGSAQADNSREAKANSSAGSGASSNLQAQIPLAAGEQPVVSSPADTFLDALESRSHLLLWWTMLTRIYESGYGRFRHNAQDRGAWGDPTTVLGNLSPSLWHMRTSHALCKNVSVSDSVKVALKGLSLDIQRVWALWGMAPGHDLGAEEDSTVLTDESQDGTGSRDRPVSEQRGAFLRRYGVEVAELAKHGNEARRLKLRLARARLQYIAQVGLRLEAVRPASLRPVDSGSVDQAGQHSTSAGPGSDVIDIADLATSSRLKLRLYDDEPSDDLWQWKELWLKTPIAAFDKDGAAVGATMDLPFAWMLGLRN